MIREARYEFLWPTLVRVNGKYEGRLGMNVEHTHDEIYTYVAQTVNGHHRN